MGLFEFDPAKLRADDILLTEAEVQRLSIASEQPATQRYGYRPTYLGDIDDAIAELHQLRLDVIERAGVTLSNETEGV